MIEFYKTIDNVVTKIDEPVKGCWINVINPSAKEIEYLTNTIKVLPEFIRSSLDEEENSHVDIDEDENQILIVIDYPNADKKGDDDSILYTTLPIGVVFMDQYIVTICLHKNHNIDEMINGKIKGVYTEQKSRFLLLLLLRISQRFLIYLRQIDRISSKTEHHLHKTLENKELIQMLGLEKSLVYFSTSLKSDEITLNKIMRGKVIKLYEEDQDLLEDVMIEVRQAIEMSNIYKDILSGTMNAYASVISNNLNIVMKVLTVITIVMAIPNMIFGYYGMNVTGLPVDVWWFPLLLSLFACLVAIKIFNKHDMFK